MNIEKPFTGNYALTHLGFRPFFLSAGAFAVIGILLWTAIYSFNWQGLNAAYPAMTWHAHEMIFGYTLAVVAGFLLTAIKNWTGQQTLHQAPLLLLTAIWLAARLLPFMQGLSLQAVASVDLLFMLALLAAVAIPVLRARQWQQAGIIAKVALMTLANAVFYLGLLGYWPAGIQLGLYAGLYLMIALIFTMGRRVIPFFIERGVGVSFKANNTRWVDRSSLVLFLLFAITDLIAMTQGNQALAGMAAALALVQIPLHGWRLYGWYHAAIWQKPLLWVLYVAYAWLVLGFGLKFLSWSTGLSPWLAVHAFAYGGIGMMTLGMMARVILGHTGRNVFEPPALVGKIFAILFAGACVRILAVWVLPQWYWWWIVIAQCLWMLAFGLFVWLYAPMLIKPRVDKRYG